MSPASTHSEDHLDDRRPCLLVCNWSLEDPAWDLIEDLSGVPWQAEGVRTVLVEPQEDIRQLAAELADKLIQHEARALLLIGRTRHETGPARLQLRTEVPQNNGQRLTENGPGVVRSTAPAAQIIEAVSKVRVSIVASSENEPDEGSRLLYEILIHLEDLMETPPVALLRFPHSMPEPIVALTVKSTATAMTQNLTPLPRFASAR